jgi:hypothetical protein
MADPFIIFANVSQDEYSPRQRRTGSQLMTTTALITGGTSGIGRQSPTNWPSWASMSWS